MATCSAELSLRMEQSNDNAWVVKPINETKKKMMESCRKHPSIRNCRNGAARACHFTVSNNSSGSLLYEGRLR